MKRLFSKKQLLFVGIIFLSACSVHPVFAQLDNPTTTHSGDLFGTPPDMSTSAPKPKPSLSKTNNLWRSEDDDSSLSPEKKKLDISENEGFIEPSIDFNPKYLKQGAEKEIKEEYRHNQYLGDFKSNGKFVKVICRDHEAVDGDRVKLLVNDKVLVENISLVAEYQTFYITLEKGFNKIDFEALNQGASGPNTAAFKVFDDSGRIIASNQWNLTTGVKATMIIVKDK